MAKSTKQIQTIYKRPHFSTVIPSEPSVVMPFSQHVSLSLDRINPDVIHLQTESFRQYAPSFHLDIFDSAITITTTVSPQQPQNPLPQPNPTSFGTIIQPNLTKTLTSTKSTQSCAAAFTSKSNDPTPEVGPITTTSFGTGVLSASTLPSNSTLSVLNYSDPRTISPTDSGTRLTRTVTATRDPSTTTTTKTSTPPHWAIRIRTSTLDPPTLKFLINWFVQEGYTVDATNAYEKATADYIIQFPSRQDRDQAWPHAEYLMQQDPSICVEICEPDDLRAQLSTSQQHFNPQTSVFLRNIKNHQMSQIRQIFADVGAIDRLVATSNRTALINFKSEANARKALSTPRPPPADNIQCQPYEERSRQLPSRNQQRAATLSHPCRMHDPQQNSTLNMKTETDE